MASNPDNTPMTSAPETLTAAVAYGMARSRTWANRMLTAWRTIDPSAPPAATANQIIDGDARMKPRAPHVTGRVRRNSRGVDSYGIPQESLAVRHERRLLVDSTTDEINRIQ